MAESSGGVAGLKFLKALVWIVYAIATAACIILAFGFVLLMFDANTSAGFAEFIYSWSLKFAGPFVRHDRADQAAERRRAFLVCARRCGRLRSARGADRRRGQRDLATHLSQDAACSRASCRGGRSARASAPHRQPRRPRAARPTAARPRLHPHAAPAPAPEPAPALRSPQPAGAGARARAARAGARVRRGAAGLVGPAPADQKLRTSR